MSQSIVGIKQYFASQSYSDATLKILESSLETVGNESSSSLQPCESRKRKIDLVTENRQLVDSLICILPVHQLILVSQSDYFKDLFEMLQKSPVLQKKEIVLRVGKGEGVYAKLFVKSLYDESILNNMSAHHLLCVMNFAGDFLCHDIIDKTINLITSVPFQGFDECINIALLTQNSNICQAKVKTSTENLLKRCATYATDLFYPLERNMAVMSGYMETLPLELLLAMLECEKRLAWHENTFLYFLGLWLEFDLSRQTSNTISKILRKVYYWALTPKYFVTFARGMESILKKWHCYQERLNNMMSCYIVLPEIRLSQNINEPKSMKYIMMKSEKENIYTSEETLFFYQGYQISPTIHIKLDASNTDYYEIGMNIHIANLTKFFKEKFCYIKTFLEFSIAAEIYAESKDEENCLNFSEVRKQRCCSFLFQYATRHSVNGRYDKLGVINKQFFKYQNSLSLVLAFKDKEQRWPERFPAHLHNHTPGGMKINIEL